MPLPTAPQLSLDRLLWRHFTWHLWVGTGIWAVLVTASSLYEYTKQRSVVLQEDFYAPNRADSLRYLVTTSFQTTVLLLGSGLLLALVGGLLRQPLLVALSRRARSTSELIWKSLLVVELLNVGLALIPWPIAYNTFGLESFSHQLRALFILSLPWLLSTGLASRRLASALSAAPAAEEAPNRPTRAN